MNILKFKKVSCKDCYKCVRHCPVGAIEVKDHRASIIDDECILCGNCTIICPQNAKEDFNEIPKIKRLLSEGKKIIASVAPSSITLPNVTSFADYAALLEAIGIQAQETAKGAYIVKTEYEKLLQNGGSRPIVSSCCPVIIQYIEKHYPEAIPFFAPVISPMEAHARLLKQENPDAYVLFIGPCIAKKDDVCIKDSAVDFVLTFDEISAWLKEADINTNAVLSSVQSSIPCDDPKRSRVFPVTGGIIRSMKKQSGKKYLAIDGIADSIAALHELSGGNLNDCFIEMNACKGGCVGGPSFQKQKSIKLSSVLSIEDVAIERNEKEDYSRDFNISYSFNTATSFKNKKTFYSIPSDEQLQEIFRRMGKLKIEDFLNCSTCGYASCRDKAIAVFNGKAEIEMCLPFMKKKAESISDKIINATPNAIITTGTDLKVQQINDAACKIFGISSVDIIGGPISRILDEYDFVNFIASQETTFNKKSYLAEYSIYLDQTFIYEKTGNIIICVMKDITAHKRHHDASMKSKINAANMADDIVEKQLRIVHEIASLLGETAAETKIAVTDLKQAILDDNENT